MSRADLRTILAHEAAHIRNHDLHWLALSRALNVLLWAQPFYWLVRRRMRLDQEALADAAAAELTSRQQYAEHLVAWARDVATRPAVRLSSAVGLWEGPSQLRRRIALLIDERFTVLRACSRRWRWICVSVIIAAVTALSTITLQPATRADEQQQGENAALQASPTETRHSVQATGSVSVFRPGAPPVPPPYKKNVLAVQAVDEAGKPITDVEVLVFRARVQTGSHELIKKLSTDDRGEVEFVNLVEPPQLADHEKLADDPKLARAPDPFLIVALKRTGFETSMAYESEFRVAIYGNRKNMRMRPAADLRGRVTDPQGQPVAGALVAAGSWGGTFAIEGINAVRTDAEGRYHFRDRPVFDSKASRARLQERNHLFTAAAPGERAKPLVWSPDDVEDLAASDLVVTHPDFAVTRVHGGDIPGVIDVQLAPAASITGRVVKFGSGEPAGGVPIKAVAQVRRHVAPEKSTDPDSAIATFHSAATQTDERGQYRLTGLPAGDYDVWAQTGANDWKDVEWVSRGIRGVAAQPGRKRTSAPDLVIGPGGTIRGRLVDADSGRPIKAGDDGPFVRPFIQFVDGPRMQATLMQTAPLTPDGTFEIGTFPGTVRIGVFVYLHKTADLGQPDYQSGDEFHNSGPGLEAGHGQSIDADFVVRPMAQIEALLSLQRKAHLLLSRGKLDDAIAAFTEGLSKNLTTSLLAGRGQTLVKTGKFAEAIADFEALVKLSPDDPGAKLFLANLLATSPVAGTRDGRRALELATDVATSAQKNLFDSDTLFWALSTVAAAHAELGEFDKAVAVQNEAIKLAPEPRQVEARSRLELYQAKRPLRDNHGTSQRPNDNAADEKEQSLDGKKDEQGSQFLRDIRTKAAPILATMAEEHGYVLEADKDLVRVPPPFAPIRMEFYRTAHPTQAQAIRRGASAMVFRWENNRLLNWGMTFGKSEIDGYTLTGILDALIDINSQHIDGPPELLNTRLAGDWVVSPGADKAQIITQLQQILQNELSLPISMELREVKRRVYVARGKYQLSPLPGQRGQDEQTWADETFTTDEIQVFGKQLVPNSGAGGGVGNFDEFLNWLGRWVGTSIVSDVDTLPANKLSWHLHERSQSTEQTREEDHNPKLVLPNITAQTGLEFALEVRPVEILFVERSGSPDVIETRQR